jgi:hypothetical protein
MNKLYIAFCGEGPTDGRLFRNLTEELVQRILLENNLTTELSWSRIKKPSGSSEESLLQAASQAKEQDILIFHRDADCSSRDECLKNHFNSGLQKIQAEDISNRVKRIIPAIPIQESEAWMLCDKALLKKLLETNLTDQQLELTYQVKRVESIRDPKQVIQRAITIHREQLPARKRKLAVNLPDMYERFSTEVSIDKLMQLPSFGTYEYDLRTAVKAIFGIKNPLPNI